MSVALPLLDRVATDPDGWAIRSDGSGGPERSGES